MKEIRKEVKIRNTRIEFPLDNVPLEVKGITLVKDGMVLLPDAPIERGVRHIKEIIDHNGILVFLINSK